VHPFTDRFGVSMQSDSDPQDIEGANKAVIGFRGMKKKNPATAGLFRILVSWFPVLRSETTGANTARAEPPLGYTL
jgi:hypothetical protein